LIKWYTTIMRTTLYLSNSEMAEWLLFLGNVISILMAVRGGWDQNFLVLWGAVLSMVLLWKIKIGFINVRVSRVLRGLAQRLNLLKDEAFKKGRQEWVTSLTREIEILERSRENLISFLIFQSLHGMFAGITILILFYEGGLL